MKEKTLTIPEIILIAGTRVALGAGVGLILAGKLDDSKRQGAGWALLAFGVLTTIPLILNLVGKASPTNSVNERRESGRPVEQLAPVT